MIRLAAICICKRELDFHVLSQPVELHTRKACQIEVDTANRALRGIGVMQRSHAENYHPRLLVTHVHRQAYV